jgi:hypothetical protein
MRIAVFTVLLIFSMTAFASQEGVLAFDNLHVDSKGIGESGPVVVDVIQRDRGIQRFSVHAFDRSYELTESQLRELGPGMYNSIQVSYERGYKELGGRTIYIKVSMAFTSAVERSKFIVITEAGSITLTNHV